ncbi:hypothetical protein E2C01_077748 [Portunus trituberculatus]|uniref:Uncharacterized protein n=1 Tax=Portunus trituberculatus TaxID=210409 RepID=A0A5B7IQJ7_PORTR|nr:hypothetical protein [Portunus trituberculatus]
MKRKDLDYIPHWLMTCTNPHLSQSPHSGSRIVSVMSRERRLARGHRRSLPPSCTRLVHAAHSSLFCYETCTTQINPFSTKTQFYHDFCVRLDH